MKYHKGILINLSDASKTAFGTMGANAFDGFATKR